MVDGAEAAGEAEIAEAEVSFLVLVDEDDVGLDVGAAALEGALDFSELAPAIGGALVKIASNGRNKLPRRRRCPRSDSHPPSLQHLYRSPRMAGYMKLVSFPFGQSLFNLLIL